MAHSSRLHPNNKHKLENHLLDKAVLMVAFIEPLTTSGQIWQIWKHKDVKGNSLLTWGFFELSAIIWLLYAIKIKNKPLIITELLWIIAQAIVIFELLYYS